VTVTSFQRVVAELLASRLARLRELTYREARALPATVEEAVVLDGTVSSVTVFRQDDAHALSGRTLVTVQVARPALLGLASFHTERGLVFSPNEPPRDATDLELQNSGA
jgi:hypothetical protein